MECPLKLVSVGLELATFVSRDENICESCEGLIGFFLGFQFRRITFIRPGDPYLYRLYLGEKSRWSLLAIRGSMAQSPRSVVDVETHIKDIFGFVPSILKPLYFFSWSQEFEAFNFHGTFYHPSP